MNNTVHQQPPINNPLVADALSRAKALASGKVLKRPSEEYLEGPIQKKVHQVPNMNFTGRVLRFRFEFGSVPLLKLVFFKSLNRTLK